MSKNKVILCILDGVGINPNDKANALTIANTPCIDKLLEECPNSEILTHGPHVGLPEGQMGNSEVGHLTIGAGRVIEQSLVRISNSLKSKKAYQSKEWNSFIETATKNNNINLVGLFSDGGVHSHIEHLYLILEHLKEHPEINVFLHIVTDGRDKGETDCLAQLIELEDFIKDTPNFSIASISGRFYTMDRDKRVEKTTKSINMFHKIDTDTCNKASDYLKKCHDNNITDEFVEPCLVKNKDYKLDSESCFLFYNFRADRMRQIVSALCLKNSEELYNHKVLVQNNKQVLCFTEYEESFKLPILFQPIEITNHLGQVVANEGLKQIRIAETEKYPHVTYFFNAGDETPLTGEDRKVVPSNKEVKTYDEKPEMSAFEIKDEVIKAIESSAYDLIVVNFANGDMVGHTGKLDAATQALETVDTCLAEILEASAKNDFQSLIFADHGNSEQMINYENGFPHTAHTTFPVFCILHNSNFKSINKGSLADIAPTTLKLLGLSQPIEMTGSSLI